MEYNFQKFNKTFLRKQKDNEIINIKKLELNNLCILNFTGGSLFMVLLVMLHSFL